MHASLPLLVVQPQAHCTELLAHQTGGMCVNREPAQSSSFSTCIVHLREGGC